MLKLISETRVSICHKNMKSTGGVTGFGPFSRKNVKNIFYRK